MSSPPPGREPKSSRRRERLVPPPTARAGEVVETPRGGGGRSAWLLCVAIVFVALLFWLLPRWAERLNEAEPAPTASKAETPSGSDRSRPQDDVIARERMRKEAEDLLTTAQTSREQLAKRSPELWAGDELAIADTLLDEGRGFLSDDRPRRAREALAAAVSTLAEIEAGADEALERALAETRTALEASEPELAKAALERAAAIAPEEAQVLALQQRVDSSPRVREQLELARVAEREERWAAAATAYGEALAADGEMEAAKRGLARARGKQADERFRRSLAEVASALDAQDLPAASQALERARSQRPGASELGPLGERLAAATLNQQSALLARQGAERESQERWKEALAKHETALELNPHLASSLEARARCATRASLQARMEGHLARRDRLSAPAVLDEARALLAEATTIEAAGPKHLALTARLDEAIESAAKPITVTLESDGFTEVTIHRVGRLGTFRRRTLELKPGTYTVTGQRSGYRDIRRELVVQPNAPPPQLPVSCDERI